jgi:alpha-beta hydrolase superfamily lysophospholipase
MDSPSLDLTDPSIDPVEASSPSTGRSRSPFRCLRWLAPAVLVIPMAAYLGISYLAADQLTRPTNHFVDLDPTLVSKDAEAWSTRTADGLTLRGWYCPSVAGRRLIVLVHGMGASWDKMAAIGRGLHRRGYDILLFDLRGHGLSDPARLTMGRREREDIRAVLAWAEDRGFTPDRIGWLGHSLGASTLLFEAVRNPDIQVAVMDSPFADLPELLKVQLPLHSHLPSWFNPGILFVAHRAFGVRTDDLRPIRLAPAWGDRPLLLIHGEADSIVPVRQAYALAAAIGPSCEAVLLPGVEHVLAYRTNPAGYVARVDGFFKEHLSQ